MAKRETSSETTMILEHVIDIKDRIGAIEEHLKSINGSIKRHEKAIENNDKELNAIKKTLYKWVGGMSVVFVLIQAAMVA